MDFMGKPFGPVPALLAVAEYVTKVHAICMRCGNLAQYSLRKSEDAQVVLLGEKNLYEPLCRDCYNLALSLLFFALRGKNHDGHNFIDNLYKKGIRIFVVEKLPDNSDSYNGAAF